jgi:hypothetical protein
VGAGAGASGAAAAGAAAFDVPIWVIGAACPVDPWAATVRIAANRTAPTRRTALIVNPVFN